MEAVRATAEGVKVVNAKKNKSIWYRSGNSAFATIKYSKKKTYTA